MNETDAASQEQFLLETSGYTSGAAPVGALGESTSGMLNLERIGFEKQIISEPLSGKKIRMFLSSLGSWRDSRSTTEIIKDIYESRKSRECDLKL